MNIPYLKTSAKTGENIEEMFQLLLINTINFADNRFRILDSPIRSSTAVVHPLNIYISSLENNDFSKIQELSCKIDSDEKIIKNETDASYLLKMSKFYRRKLTILINYTKLGL